MLPVKTIFDRSSFSTRAYQRQETTSIHNQKQQWRFSFFVSSTRKIKIFVCVSIPMWMKNCDYVNRSVHSTVQRKSPIETHTVLKKMKQNKRIKKKTAQSLYDTARIQDRLTALQYSNVCEEDLFELCQRSYIYIYIRREDSIALSFTIHR